MGAVHKSKLPIFEKLQFLDSMPLDNMPLDVGCKKLDSAEEVLENDGQIQEEQFTTEQNNVITDNQEYYEVCYNLFIITCIHRNDFFF